MPDKDNKFNFGNPRPRDSTNPKYHIEITEPPFYKVHPYFSFRYYNHKDKVFSVNKFKQKDFLLFFERIQKMCQYSWKQIFCELKKYFRAHEVTWDQTAFRKGFSHLPTEFQEYPVYQFEIFKECRVFGFFNQHNVFKIVWIDRFHNVYPIK